jgi:hypothetical protein
MDPPGFHDDEPLILEHGHLSPIIKLPKVQLFTRYKSYDLIKWKGSRRKPLAKYSQQATPPPDAARFGFAAETIGLRIYLKPGEVLELKKLKESEQDKEEPILKIPYVPPSPGWSL